MNNTQINWIANFIWGIADDVLRDVYVRGKYRDVILPMTVIRRLDAVLEPTKEAVLERKKFLDKSGIVNQAQQLCQASRQAFYNDSPFLLRDLKSRAKQQQLKADFEAYLDGFSDNVQEILDKFKFRDQIKTLVEADVLGFLIEKFLDNTINVSPNPVMNTDGTERLPALDNHAMGTVFEELIRRFNEENNEEAGEHFTPRDVVKLMTNLMFAPIADDIEDGTYLLYDGACGTGGMLTIAEETLSQLAEEKGKDISVHLYGQEVQAETYAISKADILLKGEGEEANNIKYGSTLSSDYFTRLEFDFMLSNPPYGKSWKTDLEKMGGKKDLCDHRFVIEHAGDPEYNMITRSSDGQLMFLVNKLSKIRHNTKLGSRIAEVHNGSSLFTGDAGQGESNIRRWIIENDWLEAIVALPENMFYNTGIATYIWVLTNKKPENKQGKVQLIDATDWSVPLRKNLGKKNCELSQEYINKITDLMNNFEETEQSKIFPNQEFGYWKITVERPLRLKVELNNENLNEFRQACINNKEKQLAEFIEKISTQLGANPIMNFNYFIDEVKKEADKADLKLNPKRIKLIKDELAMIDEDADKVIKKTHKAGKIKADEYRGLYEVEIDGKKVIVEYEVDTSIRDTEQVPLLEDGGIDKFFEREVLTYVPDAWIDEAKTQIGYELSFTKYFYKPVHLRSLKDIEQDILNIEKETEGLLEEIVGAK